MDLFEKCAILAVRLYDNNIFLSKQLMTILLETDKTELVNNSKLKRLLQLCTKISDDFSEQVEECLGCLTKTNPEPNEDNLLNTILRTMSKNIHIVTEEKDADDAALKCLKESTSSEKATSDKSVKKTSEKKNKKSKTKTTDLVEAIYDVYRHFSS